MKSRQNKWKFGRTEPKWILELIFLFVFYFITYTLPQRIDSMVSLFCRYLSSNYRLQYVPVAVTTQEKLHAIVNLYLDGNVITFIQTETFTNISTLRSL